MAANVCYTAYRISNRFSMFFRVSVYFFYWNAFQFVHSLCFAMWICFTFKLSLFRCIRWSASQNISKVVHVTPVVVLDMNGMGYIGINSCIKLDHARDPRFHWPLQLNEWLRSLWRPSDLTWLTLNGNGWLTVQHMFTHTPLNSKLLDTSFRQSD